MRGEAPRSIEPLKTTRTTALPRCNHSGRTRHSMTDDAGRHAWPGDAVISASAAESLPIRVIFDIVCTADRLLRLPQDILAMSGGPAATPGLTVEGGLDRL